MDAVGVRRMPGPDSARPEQGRPSRHRVKGPLVAFFSFWLLAVALQVAGGCYRADFDGYPDEAAHYITGLMVHDYLLSGNLLHPMAYAENYYLHYPKVAIGHWPPVFYVLQAAWMLLFGPSRISILLLMAAITAAVASVMFAVGRRIAGPWWAAGAGVVYVCVPMVQANTGMVMAESLLALGGLLAAYSFAEYLETGATAPALWFGAWSAFTILVKGNGWSLALLPPLALALSRQWHRLLDWRLWAAAAVATLAVPWQLATIHMVENGWELSWGLSYVRTSVSDFGPILADSLGFGILSLALLGLLGIVFLRPIESRRSPILASVGALALATLLFHAFVPANLDSRRLILALPAILLLAAGGVARLRQLAGPRLATGLALAATAWFALRVFTIPHKPVDCSSDDARFAMQIAPGSSDRLLISGSSSSEGAFISAVAMRENRPGHYVLRASKMLLDSEWSGAGERLRYSISMAEEKLESWGVSVMVLAPDGPSSPPGLTLARSIIAAYPDRWKPVAPVPGCGAIPRLFRYAGPRRPNPSPVEADLRRMLGRKITSGPAN